MNVFLSLRFSKLMFILFLVYFTLNLFDWTLCFIVFTKFLWLLHEPCITIGGGGRSLVTWLSLCWSTAISSLSFSASGSCWNWFLVGTLYCTIFAVIMSLNWIVSLFKSFTSHTSVLLLLVPHCELVGALIFLLSLLITRIFFSLFTLFVVCCCYAHHFYFCSHAFLLCHLLLILYTFLVFCSCTMSLVYVCCSRWALPGLGPAYRLPPYSLLRCWSPFAITIHSWWSYSVRILWYSLHRLWRRPLS